MIPLQERGKCIRNLLTRRDQVSHDPFLHIKDPFVLGDVAHVMALVQHAPYVRPQSERMRQYLEDDVTMAGAVALAAQRSQTQCMRSVVGQVEAAFQCE